MRNFIKFLLLLLAIVLLYVLYTFYTTGYFRTITPHFRGEIVAEVNVPGVEDMQLLHADSLLLLSSDDRASRRDGDTVQGHLYLIDLRQASWEPLQLTEELDFPFYPHGISAVPSGPGRYQVYAINHQQAQDRIEVFELFGDSLVHRRSLQDESMLSPNDLVALPGDRFYFTNDHGTTTTLGRLAEDYVGWAASNVMYFDGQNYREVADDIAYANGIYYEPGRQLLFVASPRDFLVKVYQVSSDGSLTFLEDIDCGTGVDNISAAPDGKLWIGCHPNLMAFASYAKGKKPYSPSEIITIDYRGRGDYTQEMIYLEDGQTMAGATVAVPWSELVFVGNVMDEAFLILKRSADN